MWSFYDDNTLYFAGNETPNHAELFENVTCHFASFWKDIGMFLLNNAPHETLNIIDQDFSGNCRKCCDCMFDTWLNTDSTASWSKVAAAVHSAMKPERKRIYTYPTLFNTLSILMVNQQPV